MDHIEEVKKILERYKVWVLNINMGIGERFNQEDAAEKLCQLFPQPLDDKELREKVEGIALDIWRVRITVSNGRDKILALLQPKIEEAKRQEVGDIIRCVKDAKRVHPNWAIDDVIDLLTFREETRQALKNRQALKKGESK